jgi:hypothetical protein
VLASFATTFGQIAGQASVAIDMAFKNFEHKVRPCLAADIVVEDLAIELAFAATVESLTQAFAAGILELVVVRILEQVRLVAASSWAAEVVHPMVLIKERMATDPMGLEKVVGPMELPMAACQHLITLAEWGYRTYPFLSLNFISNNLL